MTIIISVEDTKSEARLVQAKILQAGIGVSLERLKSYYDNDACTIR
jgi:hypothetical protein